MINAAPIIFTINSQLKGNHNPDLEISAQRLNGKAPYVDGKVKNHRNEEGV